MLYVYNNMCYFVYLHNYLIYHIVYFFFMIRMNLNLIGRMRSIPNLKQFLIRRVGINHISADKLLKGTASSIRFDHMEGICRELHCTPDDILEWVPSKDNLPLAEGHPLQKLAQKKEAREFLSHLNAMSTEELYEVMKQMDNKTEKQQ